MMYACYSMHFNIDIANQKKDENKTKTLGYSPVLSCDASTSIERLLGAAASPALETETAVRREPMPVPIGNLNGCKFPIQHPVVNHFLDVVKRIRTAWFLALRSCDRLIGRSIAFFVVRAQKSSI